MKIKDINSLKMEIDQLKYKTKADKEKLLVEIKLVKFQMIQDVIHSFGKLFK